LYDWYSCAITNSLGLMYLATTIREYQAKIDVVYENYKKDMVTHAEEWASTKSTQYARAHRYDYKPYQPDKPPYDPKKDDSDEYVAEMRDYAESKWNPQARALQAQMAQGYWQVVNEHLNGGTSTTYEGPTDAVAADPKFMFPTPSVPNLPAPPQVNVTAPGVPPPMPNLPDAPSAPDVPNAPDTQTLNTTAPPNLDAPNVAVPDVTVPGGTPGAPNLNAPTVDPSLLAMPAGLTNQALMGGPGGLPSTTSTNALTSANGGPGGMPKLGAPPAAPKLRKGTLGRSATPPGQEAGGRSPASPNTVRRGTGRPDQNQSVPPGEEEEFGRPSGTSSTPPVLRGRSGVRPSSNIPNQDLNRSGTGSSQPPGAAPPVLNRKRQSGPGQQTPGTPIDDDVLRPEQPGTSRPVLRGSRTPTGPQEVEQRPGSTVRGSVRRPGTSEPEMTSRHKSDRRSEEIARTEREYEKIRQLLSDDEAWTVPTPGGAVLDNAVPQRPAATQGNPKPVLGSGAG
jgi:hypothetical protein